MRILIFLILIGVSGGAAWWWHAHRDPAAEDAAASRSAEMALAQVGLRRMLTGHEVFKFSELVLTGPIGDGIFDFRGFVHANGKTSPAFGQARSRCTEGADDAACWEITYLEADGARVDLDPPTVAAASGAGPATEPPATPPAARDPATASATSVAAEAPASAAPATRSGAEDGAAEVGAASPAEPQPAPAEAPAAAPDAGTTGPSEVPDAGATGASPLPAPTHRVARPLINTRSGPGTGNPVVATLVEGQQLALVDQEGGWGRFVILDGEDKGVEVWVALSILEDTRR